MIFHSRLLGAGLLVVSAAFATAESRNSGSIQSGLASRCVLDSQYLAASDEKGFQFDAPSKKTALNLGALFMDGPEVAFQNAPYRNGNLQSLGLTLASMPGAQGIAVQQEGEGDDASWEIQCYRAEAMQLLGKQWATRDSLEEMELYGVEDKLGWPLTDKGNFKAWKFITPSNAVILPGQGPGRVVSGMLTIGDVREMKIRLPGSDNDFACKRIKIRFKPKSRVDWTCGVSGCEPGPSVGTDDDPELGAYTRTSYLYWRVNVGVIAEAKRMDGPNAMRWAWQWFTPD